MHRPTYKRIRRVVLQSLAIDFVAYTLIATAGYFSTFNFTNPIVIYRQSPSSEIDYMMLVCALGLLIVMLASVPCNYNPFR